MPTDNERKALWFLVLVVVSGSGVRLWRARTPTVPAAEADALRRQIERVDSVRATRQSPKTSKTRVKKAVIVPAVDSQPIDLDRATVTEIERLPGIGPTLAQRIVAHRDTAGSFGEIEALCQVRGVGPALAARLRPLVTFSGARRPLDEACGTAQRTTKKRVPARARQPS
ncbi:MAG: ComEA family DNA-binding protein [Gemmatimonadaceae bacterium]